MASSGRLKPGEKGSIKASLETAGRHGRLVKGIRVKSNDPSSPDRTLILRADVRKAEPRPEGPKAPGR